MPDCENCNEKCPQAEMAHEIALGRMYATQELVRLVKQVDSGQLVEVVRCEDCKHHHDCGVHFCDRLGMDCPDDSEFYCKYGERKEDD